jgi:hypothetical protein
MAERHWYRVEHRGANEPRLLGYVADVVPHPASLVPFVSRLLRDGATEGEVVLVDDHTGADVARQSLGHGPRRAPGRRQRH